MGDLPKRQMHNDDIENILGFHPATDDVREKYKYIRAAFTELAQDLNEMIPDSREKSLAFTHLQTAQMFYIGSVAIHETPVVGE